MTFDSPNSPESPESIPNCLFSLVVIWYLVGIAKHFLKKNWEINTSFVISIYLLRVCILTNVIINDTMGGHFTLQMH